MSDDDKRFAETVPVFTGRGIHMVGSAREAAETLLFRWPEGPETRKRRAARAAALKALSGAAPAETARKALIAAAVECGILATGVRTK